MKNIQLEYKGITNSESHRDFKTGIMDFSDMLKKHTKLNQSAIDDLVYVYENMEEDDLLKNLSYIANDIYKVIVLMIREKESLKYKNWEEKLVTYFGSWCNDTLKYPLEVELESNLEWEDIDVMSPENFYKTYLPTKFLEFVNIHPNPKKETT